MSNYPPPTPDYQTPPGHIPFATAAPPPPPPPPRSIKRGLFGWLLFIGLIVILYVLLRRDQGPTYELPLSEFMTQLKAGNLRNVAIEADGLSGDFINPPPY